MADNRRFVIGVDVGGTNTDAVVMAGKVVCGVGKVSTTSDVTHGVALALTNAMKCAENHLTISDIAKQIKRVNIGTTHFLNAVIQRKDLAKVGVIRICGKSSRALPPFVDFPRDLRQVLSGGSHLIQGGFQMDGRALSDIDVEEIKAVVKQAKADGVRNYAVAGVFSPGKPEHEVLVEEVIKELHPDATVTLSHDIGPVGLLERENASILNESLKPLCATTLKGFEKALKDIHLGCSFYLTQNDGTLISAEKSLSFPVLTFSSGATNSMRGAALLSGLKEAIVIDVGGTSTDVGMISAGFPRESQARVKVGGVNTNFRMPDVYSVGLGGGSIVSKHGDAVSVGPQSVAYKLQSRALVFGGDTLTATDVAVGAGLVSLGTTVEAAKCIDSELVKKAMEAIHEKVDAAIDQIKLADMDIPIVLVGGGSILIDCKKALGGSSMLIKPDFYEVANAVGAALGQVGGVYNQVVYLEKTTREDALAAAQLNATKDAVSHGAVEASIVKVMSDIQHISYVSDKSQPANVKVKVVGDLDHYTDSGIQQLPVAMLSTVFHKQEQVDTPVTQEGKDDGVASVTVAARDVCVSKSKESSDKDWLLDESDVEKLCIGAGILGCGGGGSPYLGKLRLLKALEEGRTLRIIHPNRLKDKKGVIAPVAFMGSPIIVAEKLISGKETLTALALVTEMLDKGLTGTQSEDEMAALSKSLPLTKHDNRWVYSSDSGITPKSPHLLALMSAEIGGMNSVEPLVLASELGLPVVDCDGMGRAFPKLEHFVPFVLGLTAAPSAVANENGDVLGAAKISSAEDLEMFFRIKAVEWGQAAGVCCGIMSPKDLMEKSCLFTLSRAWHVGNAVTKAVASHSSPVKAILNECHGVLLISGKVSSIEKRTAGGFTYGNVTIEGTGEFVNQSVNYVYQNENLVVWKGSKSGAGDVLAAVPDLITLVDSESGEVVPTEENLYGLRVSVLVLPAMPIMQSKAALETFGPKAFPKELGIDNVEYKPIGTYIELPVIPTC